MNYYCKFIGQYSHIAGPLFHFTKKEQAFEWDNKAQQSFKELKGQFTCAPVLVVFDPDKPIFLETDASDYALGAIMYQKDNQGQLHPVAFLSWKFNSAELNYQIHDKELMAIVFACKQWWHYL